MAHTHKELLLLNEEERALVNLHTKVSDQLNRLRVEELALISMLRLQSRPASSTISQCTDDTTNDSKVLVKHDIADELDVLEEKYQDALELGVSTQQMPSEEEEDEDEDEDDDEEDDEPESVTDQLSAFLDELSARNK